MLRLEDFMEIQKLHHDGWSVTEIARHLDIDRKTVRKYLKEAPREYERKPKSWKIDPWRAWLRERWEQGVQNASRLFAEMRKRGYDGCYTQVKRTVREWRSEGRERAFVRFETAPGEQAQMDWGHFGNWDGRRLYGFALTLGWSRMQYVEFTQRQDVETLLNCMVHAFHFFGGVTATVLTDNMKTVVVDRIDGQPRFHPKMLDFASYYGFVPRVCHPYRPETKGKIESTIRYIKSSFWPGLQFGTLAELNRQALAWCDEVNRRVHGTTREVPLERFGREALTPLAGQPDYDTSYVSHRQAAKDCLFCYRGNRYSVPHAYAGKSVVVRQPLDSGTVRIFYQRDLIAEHKTATGKGEMIFDPAHYAGLPRRSRMPIITTPADVAELTPGPGVGLHHPVPVVELRSLTIYEEVAHVAAI
ncbi:MAG: IS21 family transposase [Silvibacterium sp.]|jgi:transposase